uniref:Uncharacterized protein n=1 Tax=Setaria italica TaxID=4555 RepID=K3XU88_SETIT
MDSCSLVVKNFLCQIIVRKLRLPLLCYCNYVVN